MLRPFRLLKLLFALVIAFILLTQPSRAGGGSSALHSLLTLDETRGWEGVGRLNMGARSFCTGALIAENLVLTAAHCLFDPDSGTRIDVAEIEFLAGWRSGRASAYRGVRRAVVHPGYGLDTGSAEQRVRYDLALLELDRPIRSTSIRPFAVHEKPRKGDEVGVVSYALGRADAPSLQESCKVLARQSGALILSCEVDFGSSGAPVFVFEDGVAQIVSVISAKARVRDLPVSLGTDLARPLARMLDLLDASEGAFSAPQPTARLMTGDDGISSTGARFLRP